MKWCRYILFSLVLCCLSACTPRMIREAQDVVYEADSLRAAGQMYSDSTQIARACRTLEKAEWFYADDYARSCYHYGRLLREKDDPVSAMQVFINASHSRSHDYHILGRVYSNMGDICHLAGEYVLSREMYERCAKMYLHNGDTLLYYYGIYRAAFEDAMTPKALKCDSILNIIERANLGNDSLLAFCHLTRAQRSIVTKRYRSAARYAHRSLSYLPNESTAILILAQAYSWLGVRDSAVFYANMVLNNPCDIQHRANALYIMTQDDDTRDKGSIREVSAQRSDTQKQIEIRRGKVAQACQLLEQDVYNGPEWRGYVIIIFIVIALLAVTVIPFIWKKRKQHLQQQITQISNKHADSIVASIQKHIDVSDLNNTLHWKEYAAMKIEADLYMGGIVSKLEASNLNETEVRFCILTILDIRQKQIAEIIHYSYPSGIKTLKKRISDKLHTTPPELREHLLHKM